jgi:hypothetical protein
MDEPAKAEAGLTCCSLLVPLWVCHQFAVEEIPGNDHEKTSSGSRLLVFYGGEHSSADSAFAQDEAAKYSTRQDALLQ